MRGFSLVECLVTISVGATLLIICTQLLQRMMSLERTVGHDAQLVRSLTRVSELLTRDAHGATRQVPLARVLLEGPGFRLLLVPEGSEPREAVPREKGSPEDKAPSEQEHAPPDSLTPDPDSDSDSMDEQKPGPEQETTADAPPPGPHGDLAPGESMEPDSDLAPGESMEPEAKTAPFDDSDPDDLFVRSVSLVMPDGREVRWRGEKGRLTREVLQDGNPIASDEWKFPPPVGKIRINALTKPDRVRIVVERTFRPRGRETQRPQPLWIIEALIAKDYRWGDDSEGGLP